jgi:hypothetical protein
MPNLFQIGLRIEGIPKVTDSNVSGRERFQWISQSGSVSIVIQKNPAIFFADHFLLKTL